MILESNASFKRVDNLSSIGPDVLSCVCGWVRMDVQLDNEMCSLSSLRI